MNTHFDTFAYTNRLRHLPPRQKLLFASTALVIALCSHPPVQLAIALWFAIWIVQYAGIPAPFYRKTMMGVGVFLLTSLTVLVINAVPVNQIHSVQSDRLLGATIFHWHLYLSTHGLKQAVEIFCRAIASTSCMFFIVFTIPIVELLSIFIKLGFPVILSELLLLSYRFIFLLADVAQKSVTAQIARGGYRTHKLAMNSVGLLIRQLLQHTVERYHQLSLGVKARGFNHEFRFWQPQRYQYSRRYAIEAIVGCVGLIGWEILIRTFKLWHV